MSEPRPVCGHSFQVHVAEVGPRGGSRPARELAVQQVVLPTLRAGATAGAADGPGVAADLLVLRRGHTGSTELHDWWVDERNPKSRRTRTVSVAVLGHDRRPVTIWRFTGCHLVSLAYSPLDALESSVLIESAEIAFETVRQSPATR